VGVFVCADLVPEVGCDIAGIVDDVGRKEADFG
jgi:hypothetical protein